MYYGRRSKLLNVVCPTAVSSWVRLSSHNAFLKGAKKETKLNYIPSWDFFFLFDGLKGDLPGFPIESLSLNVPFNLFMFFCCCCCCTLDGCGFLYCAN